MFNPYPKFSSSCITSGPQPGQATAPPLSGDLTPFKREVSAERAVLMWSLPLRYSGLPVRRRLIRMMLTLQRCGEAAGSPEQRGQDAYLPAMDYAQSVIDTAMLRGELRCRPSGEMARDYLKQAEGLLSLMNSTPQDKAFLRREVRRRTADFLRRYAPVADAGWC